MLHDTQWLSYLHKLELEMGVVMAELELGLAMAHPGKLCHGIQLRN
jgi:hypothetical protein